jgi:hypothetical protein
MTKNDINDRSNSTRNNITTHLIEKNQSWMPCFNIISWDGTHIYIILKWQFDIKQWHILHLPQTSIMYCTMPWMKPQTLPHTWVMSHDFFCVRITTFSSSSVDLIPGLVLYESFRKDPILGKHKVWCNSGKLECTIFSRIFTGTWLA